MTDIFWDETDWVNDCEILFAEAYRKYKKERSNAPKEAAYSSPIDNRQVK